MNKILAGVVIVIVLVVLGGLAYFAMQPSPGNIQLPQNASQSSSTQTDASASQNSNSQKIKFSDTPMAQYAYLISTDNYDSKTQQALSGFTVTKKASADGSVEYTLNATNPQYQTQTYTVKPGQKLYFIETNLRDDPANQELNLSDDTAVVVDSQGYVVQ